MVTVQGIALIAGVIFVLIAIVGGGFTIKDLGVPAVPKNGRIGSGIVGVSFISYALLIPLFANSTHEDSHRSPSPNTSGVPIIHEDDQPYESSRGDGIQISNLLATGEHKPLQLNDRITVQFTLRNIGEHPVTLEDIFVGARNPANDRADPSGLGEFTINKTFQPGEGYHFRKSDILYQAGRWTLFPCYRTTGRALPGVGYCPELWRSFPVLVVEYP